LIAILDDLKASALEQENADFDPSGTGAPVHIHDVTNTSRSSPTNSLSNGITSITTGLSDMKTGDSDSLGHGLHDSPADQKTAWLEHMFPSIPRRELISVLASHEWSLDGATDELLNLSFLRQGSADDVEDVPMHKGVDGFAEDLRGPRKGRNKQRVRTQDSSRASSASSYEPESPTLNVWSNMSEDVEFICSRTRLQPQTVRSAYHHNGARLSTTIRALAIKEGSIYNKMSEADAVLELQIAEFQGQFEHVPKAQVYGVLTLARNIPSAAQELLQAMIAEEDTVTRTGKLQGVVQYSPIDLRDDKPWETMSAPKSSHMGQPHATAASHRQAATQHFDQASAAYRKSKSDRLYGGAAAYYSEIGRERAKAAKDISAAEADFLVSQQSSSTSLDLHGVSVSDAVRIASSRTQSWWDGLGDAKYVSGGGGPVRAGFKIVTGVGTHSRNHAPRIGPAVSKMLVREGWKVEVGHGELRVTGRSHR
jgi:hypothetical protein